ncbi:MAG: (d)CMP kinase [Candidatus Omnitrophica bacterium]|nr:(d)CMP kinase [Candidatus Omnitrophota bacterium]
MIIAIDGPAGSGKTTIAKLLAQRLGIGYLDTGATYRALTFYALENNLDLTKSEPLVLAAENITIGFLENQVILNEINVTDKIRTPKIDKNISAVVKHPQVRSVMVDLQRKIAVNKDYVVEGRDITTVVFPNAEFKFYLDADTSLRARRRYEELLKKGLTIDYQEVLDDLANRDYSDKNRAVGPLKIADDAQYVDTTNLTIGQVVSTLAEYIKNE